MHRNTKHMIRALLLLGTLALPGCLSFTSDNTHPPPPQNTTVVVPPGSGTTVVCANGAPPPCN